MKLFSKIVLLYNKTKYLRYIPKYDIQFINAEKPDVPYYRTKGQEDTWTEVPCFRGHGLFYDPLEDLPQYQKISSTVDKLLKKEMEQKNIRGLGSCHYAWNRKKKILNEYYGINWHTPQELNPSTCFD